MHVLVVENMPDSMLGLLGTALDEAGARLDIRKAYLGAPLPEGPDEHDALVVLGGEQSALDDELFPYLPQLAGLMKQFGDAGRAVLGICLGSQILARAYGADNLLGAAREFGWQTVALTREGLGDPVLSALGPRFPIFQWHADTFTLPDDAVHLAGNDTAAHQAFRVGRAAYGMQFHFEAGHAVVAAWKELYADQIERIDAGWRARSAELEAASGAAAEAAGLAIARAWIARIEVSKPAKDTDVTVVSDHRAA